MNFDTKLISLNKKISQIKESIYSLKMNLKNCKYLIRVILGNKSHFKEDGTQNYLLFQPMYRYFKRIGSTDHILEWKSKGLSEEVIKPPTTSNNRLVPKLSYFGSKAKAKFNYIYSWSNSKYIHCL